MNAHAIRETDLGEVVARAKPFLREAGLEESDPDRLARVVALARENVTRLSELPAEVEYLFGSAPKLDSEALAALEQDSAPDVLLGLRTALADEPEWWTAERFIEMLRSVGREVGGKGKELYMPVRAALTGRTHGPSLGSIAELLGGREAGARVARALEVASGKEE